MNLEISHHFSVVAPFNSNVQFNRLYDTIIRRVQENGGEQEVKKVANCALRGRKYPDLYKLITGKDLTAQRARKVDPVARLTRESDSDDDEKIPGVDKLEQFRRNPVVANDSDNEIPGEDDDSDDDGVKQPNHTQRIVLPHEENRVYTVNDFWQALEDCKWNDKNSGVSVHNPAVVALRKHAGAIRAHFKTVLESTIERYQEVGLQRAANLTDDELAALSSHVIAMGLDFHQSMAFDLDLIMYYATERIYNDFREVVKKL